MATAESSKQQEEFVNKYFQLVDELRKGNEKAVPQLVDMWDPDGTFEFAGAPPVTGTFHGIAAIHTLYKNRFDANGMPLKLEAKDLKTEDVALGRVHTEVSRIRFLEGKTVAGWSKSLAQRGQQGSKSQAAIPLLSKMARSAASRLWYHQKRNRVQI
jgi:hypothetical protein